MKRSLALLALCGLAASCAAQGSASPDPSIDIGTHRLQFHDEGAGWPVVVLDAGLGDPLDKLRPLQERLARHMRVVSFNRAGYGQSEAGPLPRDCDRAPLTSDRRQ